MCFCIQYSIKFKKDDIKIQALIDSNNEVNAIIPTYAAIPELHVCLTNIRASKIDRSILSIYNIVLANFQLKNKLKKRIFFKKPF